MALRTMQTNHFQTMLFSFKCSQQLFIFYVILTKPRLDFIANKRTRLYQLMLMSFLLLFE